MMSSIRRSKTFLVVDISGLSKTEGKGNTLELTTRKVLDLLIDDVVNLERPHHVGDKLWMNIGVPDPVVQKLSCRALVLGGDLLWLEGDVERWHLSRTSVRLQLASHHPDERRLQGRLCSSTVCC